ncbi:uncharacterized protein LOC107272894 [Cephus cinctus]|uniref:Uncharacterized protein LOC107272894 n=1 Tax=Cephus cinctus TaxID=211228 RepID=A0AAJ7FSF4_CEPCN|nr:uncharacterized protein LOC107272894 [Cephus cinctus]
MNRHLWLGVTFVFALITGASCLRDVRLEVVPEVVQRGHEVIVRCYYDVEKRPLYSVKWYRGKHEFYRFSPSEFPPTKIFNISGIDIDLMNSNESQVTICNVDFGLSGNFSCEVTVEAPTFSTAFVSKKLTVVSLPQGRPTIVLERDRYDPGDVLNANCSLPASKPPTRISFSLNNKPVGSSMSKPRKLDNGNGGSQTDTGLQSSNLTLTIQPSHYSNGQLTLRCIAEIPGIFSSTSEVQIGTGLREPVPERVTSENGCPAGTMLSLFVVCLSLVHLLLR